MSISRPLEHMAFAGFLQNHGVLPANLELTDRSVFDRFLRHSALFTRGLVMVDSDLNNNKVFHRAAEDRGGLFWQAIKLGFIRRAIREDDRGNRVSQAEIAEDFRKKSSPEFHRHIPADHPALLDAAFASAERDQEPLIWTRQRAHQVTLDRMLALLKSLRAKGGDPVRPGLIDAIENWMRERMDAGVVFGAADLDRDIGSGSVGRTDAWREIWPQLLNANLNNIPYIFEGRLPVINAPGASDRMLPAGPESGPTESAAVNFVYTGEGEQVELSVRPSAPPPVSFDVNEGALESLSLAQIEELREEASPASFFDTRFSATGSAEMLSTQRDSLDQHVAAYFDRLAVTGVILTEDAVREGLAAPIFIPSPTGLQNIQIVATAMESYIEYCMLDHHPYIGAQIVACDLTTLIERLDRSQSEALRRNRTRPWLLFKRPDYRVIQRLAGTL